MHVTYNFFLSIFSSNFVVYISRSPNLTFHISLALCFALLCSRAKKTYRTSTFRSCLFLKTKTSNRLCDGLIYPKILKATQTIIFLLEYYYQTRSFKNAPKISFGIYFIFDQTSSSHSFRKILTLTDILIFKIVHRYLCILNNQFQYYFNLINNSLPIRFSKTPWATSSNHGHFIHSPISSFVILLRNLPSHKWFLWFCHSLNDLTIPWLILQFLW